METESRILVLGGGDGRSESESEKAEEDIFKRLGLFFLFTFTFGLLPKAFWATLSAKGISKSSLSLDISMLFIILKQRFYTTVVNFFE